MSDETVPRCPVCGFELRAEASRKPLRGPLTCPARFCGVQLEPDEEGRLRIDTFRLANHYSLCVLPFAFTDQDVPALMRRLDKSDRWRRLIFSLDNPDHVDRTEYFLPYVRRFLFPTLFASPGEQGKRRSQSEPTCRHYDFDLSLLGQSDGEGVPLSLACHDERRNLTFRYNLRLTKVELIGFSHGVGFLILRFSCADPRATYFDQMNAMNYLRPIAPLYRGFEMPELTSGKTSFGVPQLLPYLLAEFSRGSKCPASPAEVDSKTVMPELPVKPIYDDRMMVYTFSCLDKETSLANPQQCDKLLDRNAVVHFDEETRERRPRRRPEMTLKKWLRMRWQGFSKDGGTLVVFNTDTYNERYLGTYHGTYYFDVFLLATLQRVTLLTLYERLSDIGALTTGSRASHKLLRRVRFDLLLFKNQCWFSQISNREKGMVLWRKWQRVFENRTLLEEVNEQSEELDNYLKSKTRDRVEWLVRLGGFMAAAVPAILGLNILLGDAPWIDTLRWILLISLVTGTGLFALFGLKRQRSEV